MTRSDIEAYWELANLVKQAADEEGIDLDELAEEMDEEELAEFLDAAMEGALEGAEYSPFMEKTAALLEKVAADVIGVGSSTDKGLIQTLREIWQHAKGRHPKIGKYGPLAAGAAGGAGAMGYYLRKKLKRRR
jgi:type II secretory pathway component PulF